MRKWLVLAGSGLVLFVWLVLRSAPAQLLAPVADRAGFPVQLQWLDGTVWAGHAGYAEISLNGGTLPLGDVSWTLSPWSLMLLSPSVTVETTGLQLELSASARISATGNWSVTAARGHFPLHLLEAWVPQLVSGEVLFDIAEAHGRNDRLFGVKGIVNLRNAQWLVGNFPMPLGHYHADIGEQDNSISLVLDSDPASPLIVTGAATATPDGRYQLNIRLYPQDSLASELKQSLSWLGRREADGAIRVKKEGLWP